MGELNKQQLCAALNISESTVRRLEQAGLPFTKIGVRTKRYDLEECKAWLRANPVLPRSAPSYPRLPSSKADREFLETCEKVKVRVRPS